MEYILEIKDLTKYYENNIGVKDLSLSLNKGEIFGYIGPNGAGKSTTIRTIMNLINKSSGSIKIFSKESDKKDILTKEKIGYLPSEVHLYEDLKVKQMLDFHESFYKRDLSLRRNELVKMFDLDVEKKISELSFGNQKKLGIILAFMHDPQLIILDEPTSGLDPIMQNVFYNLLLTEKAKGKTIFYSTHILSEIKKVCDRIGIIKNGVLIKLESLDDLLEKKLVTIEISSPENEKIINDLNIIEFKAINDSIFFSYSKKIDELIKALANYKIEKLFIKEADLEDLFLHYYEK